MVSSVFVQPGPGLPERFVTDVSSELSAETVRKRWPHVNVVLRLSMITGLPLEMESTLNLLCDMAAEIISYDRALVFCREEGQEPVLARIARGFPVGSIPAAGTSGTNILNLCAAKYARPLLVVPSRAGRPASSQTPAFGPTSPSQLPKQIQSPATQIDALLDFAGAASALAIPLFITDKVCGSLQFFSSSANAFTREDAQLLWVFALVAENVLTRESSRESLVRFAFTDYLTGLRTRGYFEQQLDLEFKRAERRKQKFALVMIDIDHFKRLNDTYGHHVGDQVLREVASILVKDMREVDTVARYGGEEFVIILPETAETGALYVAERLRRAVEQAKFFTGFPHPVQHLTISLGVAVYDNDARFKRDLIESSDAALYAAKREGRNRTISYSELAEQEKSKAS